MFVCRHLLNCRLSRNCQSKLFGIKKIAFARGEITDMEAGIAFYQGLPYTVFYIVAGGGVINWLAIKADLAYEDYHDVLSILGVAVNEFRININCNS